MCCVVFRGPVLYKQKIIYHMTTNKTNIWLKATPQVMQSVMCPSCFECQSLGNSVTAFFWISLYFQTLFLWLRSSWERRRRRRRTEGAGGRSCSTLSVRLCMFSAHCPSCQKKKKFKNRNLLVVYSCHPSATVAKSSMYFIFHFYVLCFFFFVHF